MAWLRVAMPYENVQNEQKKPTAGERVHIL